MSGVLVPDDGVDGDQPAARDDDLSRQMDYFVVRMCGAAVDCWCRRSLEVVRCELT